MYICTDLCIRIRIRIDTYVCVYGFRVYVRSRRRCVIRLSIKYRFMGYQSRHIDLLTSLRAWMAGSPGGFAGFPASPGGAYSPSRPSWTIIPLFPFPVGRSRERHSLLLFRRTINPAIPRGFLLLLAAPLSSFFFFSPRFFSRLKKPARKTQQLSARDVGVTRLVVTSRREVEDQDRARRLARVSTTQRD